MGHPLLGVFLMEHLTCLWMLSNPLHMGTWVLWGPCTGIPFGVIPLFRKPDLSCKKVLRCPLSLLGDRTRTVQCNRAPLWGTSFLYLFIRSVRHRFTQYCVGPGMGNILMGIYLLAGYHTHPLLGASHLSPHLSPISAYPLLGSGFCS